MRIVLISPAHPRVENDNLDPPMGIMYLSAALKQAGHKCIVLDFAGGRKHHVPEADIYGFTTYTPTYWWCLEKRDEIRDMYPDAKFIAGGTHVTALPDMSAGEWDCVVVGEGEQAIIDIANNGISQRIIYAEPIMDIDSIPLPDYNAVDIRGYERTLLGERLLSVLTSRGCPYKCAFCNSIIWNGARRVRFRQPGCVAEEIEYLMERYDITHFRFIDDLFAMSESRIEALAKVLRPLDIIYRCTARCNIFNAAIAHRLVDSGCVQVEFGVESGSDRVLKMMNKRQTSQDVRRSLQIAKYAGLKVRVYLIVGFPGETWETLNETCDLMLECAPDEVLVHTPIPFPGTQLYGDGKKLGITWKSNNFRDYMQISKDRQSFYLLSHSTADRDMIKEMWEYAVKRLEPIKWYYGRK